MKTLFVLILGAAIGIAGYLFYQENFRKSPLEKAGDKITEGADQLKDKFNETFDLDVEKIKEESARTGKVIRKKAEEASVAIANAAGDARITGEIKSKFALESDLSAVKISVNTTGGVVTLSGTVSSHEAIQKAMKIALQVDGVSQVVSTLQVKS